MLQYLTDIGPTLSALASTLLALLTFFSVRAARSMATQMLESRLAQFRPLLYPILESGDQGMAINIRNVGTGAAMDIDIDLSGTLEEKLHVPFIGAGEKTDVALRIDGYLKGELRMRVRYKDIFQNRISVTTCYRLTEHGGSVIPYDTTLSGGTVCSRGVWQQLRSALGGNARRV